MKNIRIKIAASVGAVLLLASVFFVFYFKNRDAASEVFEGSDIVESVDDYIKINSKEKASAASASIILEEGKDFSFDAKDKDFQKYVKDIKKKGFDTVFLKSGYFTSPFKKKETALFDSGKYFKEKGFKVFLCLSSDFENFDTFERDVFDGYLVLDEKKSENIKKLLSEKNEKDFELLLFSDLNGSVSEKAKNYTGVFLALKENETVSTELDESLLKDEKLLYLSFPIDKVKESGISGMDFLKQVYELNNLKSLKGRVLPSYKAVKKNYDNCFGAFSVYMTEGISPILAFREPGITGYDGRVFESDNFEVTAEFYASNLFPCYFEGKRLELKESGSVVLDLRLKEGENNFSFTQSGKTFTYKVKASFKGELIKSLTPEGEITLLPKETVTVTIIAYYLSDVRVKLGSREWQAKKVDPSATGLVAFSAKVKMPDTREEISSLGQITAVAVCGEKSDMKKGAFIKAGEAPSENIGSEKNPQEETVPLKIENYVPTLPEKDTQNNFHYGLSVPSVNINVPTENNSNPVFTGNEMAFISVPFADTRPLYYNDDTYDPAFSALPYGTVDYITKESEAYSSELQKTIHFYELQSGFKVKKEDVTLVPKSTLPSNSLSVRSSEGKDGKLKITLSTGYKVPFRISFAPQGYFSMYGTKFNITSFNSNYVAITFYYTTSVIGNVNSSLSNVISSASWDINSENKTATLYMPLKNNGEYYGASGEYDSTGNLVITISRKPKSLSGCVILLDPGHGGKDSGALGFDGAVKECDINLSLAYYVQGYLSAKGATVYSTRSQSTDVSLEERKALARSLKPDFFVSIHSNAAKNNSSSIGTATYYYKPFSKKLASCIYTEMLGVFKNNLYAGRADLYDSISDGTPYYPFSVTRLDECPSVLIETGYVSNNEECYKLIDGNNQRLLGEAIARGIEKAVMS